MAEDRPFRVDDFYNRLAASWDKSRPACMDDVFKQVLLRLSDGAPSSVLDFGCGTGLLCGYLHKHLPEASIHGIDIAAEMIERAKLNCPACTFQVADILTADLLCFDAIVSKDVFNHVEDIPGTVARLDELLSPGGTLVVANRDRGGTVKADLIATLLVLGYEVSTDHFDFDPTEEEIEGFLRTLAGFEDRHRQAARAMLEASGAYYLTRARKGGPVRT